ATGEILTFVSSPSYDPNMMVGRERGNNYMKLLYDPYKPMFIRPIQAQYPPGSVFKVVSALTAQQAGVIEAGTIFNFPGGYRYGRVRTVMPCTRRTGTSPALPAIHRSCICYFGHTYARMIDTRNLPSPESYAPWREATKKLGIGQQLGI